NHVPATPPAVPLAAVQEKGRPVEPAPSGTPAASGPSGMAANGASGAFEILKAQSNAPAKSVIPFDARRPGVASPNAGAQGVVFLPVSTPADRAQPRPTQQPEVRTGAAGASDVLAYLQAISR